jgi:radical SAM superfamily enzyme YgiQ (UPF0313 family)
MSPSTQVLLVSCYELGHQPFAIASAWAQLEAAGLVVEGIDASVDAVDDASLARSRLVAISVPMHTALRLGVAIAQRARVQNPGAHICLFGLYASMNAPFLLDTVADSVIGGEFESALVELAAKVLSGDATRGTWADPILKRLPFARPTRDRLPSLDRYAHLIGPRAGQTRIVGYVEASRGCLHRCLHCPITPVYDGRFFVVPREVVLADADQQIRAGARHITFGDPDFFNGVGHSMAVVRALHAAHPDVTFDVTIKVEHILKHRRCFDELAHLGCLFIVSAVESLSDVVLKELDKGHTRADVLEALRVTAGAGIALRPSFVAFTPWTTLNDYIALCDFIVEEGLVDHTDPIQLAIRLLIPPRSALLDTNIDGASLPPGRDLARPWLGRLVNEEFGYRWEHPDTRMDALHMRVLSCVEVAARDGEDNAVTFETIRTLAYDAAGAGLPRRLLTQEGQRRFVPRLSEPWFCCAEPNAVQLGQVSPAPCCGDPTP